MDKDGEDVLLVSTGAKLANVGTVTVSQNGISTKVDGDYRVNIESDRSMKRHRYTALPKI